MFKKKSNCLPIPFLSSVNETNSLSLCEADIHKWQNFKAIQVEIISWSVRLPLLPTVASLRKVRAKRADGPFVRRWPSLPKDICSTIGAINALPYLKNVKFHAHWLSRLMRLWLHWLAFPSNRNTAAPICGGIWQVSIQADSKQADVLPPVFGVKNSTYWIFH